MKFMECQTCRSIVQTNNVGVCLGCQRGFIGIPQEDLWKDETLSDLVKLKKEIEDALQVETEKVQVLPKRSKKR